MIGTPLGYIMWACYALVQNFGWAIIIFTLIVKAAMFPLNLKQQKNTAVSALFAPKVREIQTKYRNDKEKMQEELTKLQKEGYNPTGGCGTMLITFLILFGVIDVVYKPMTHMEHFGSADISAIVTTAEKIDITQTIMSSPEDYAVVLEYLNGGDISYVETTVKDENGKDVKTNNRVVLDNDFKIDEVKKTVEFTAADLEKLGVIATDSTKLSTLYGNTRLSNQMRSALSAIDMNYRAESLYRELRALNCYDRLADKTLFEAETALPRETIDRFEKLSNNIYFFGINLGEQPSWAWNTLIIIPIISFLFSLAQMYISQRYNEKQNPELAAQQGASMKIMMLTMPLISLWISFTVPAGAGFYWAISYLFGILQIVITNKFWPADKIRAEAKAKMEAQAAKTERKAKIVEVDADGNTVERTDRISQLTQKEIRELNKKKLEAARRADAEKYGEEYKEAPEDDDF